MKTETEERIFSILVRSIIVLAALATCTTVVRCEETKRDDGLVACPASSHRHPLPAEIGLSPEEGVAAEVDQNGIHIINLDGKCYDDDDNPLPEKDEQRKVLPVPKPVPPPDKHLSWS